MKNNHNKLFSFVFIFLLCAFFVKIYASWVFPPITSAGDWPYYSYKMLEGFTTVFAHLWTAQGGIGLGGVNPEFPIFSYLSFTAGFFTITLHIPWVIVSAITWFGVFLVVGIFSSIKLYQLLRPQAQAIEYIMGSFIYVVNSYILMIVGGGQMGIALAYAITPLVLWQFIKIEQSMPFTKVQHLLRESLIMGLIISLQILFEPRITYLTVYVISLYFLYSRFLEKRVYFSQHFFLLGTVMGTVLLIHAYWLIPFALFHLLSVPKGIASQSGFSFFSFADFSTAFAFLHPNWPTNVFGKVSFLRPEFLLYPITAFSGLLFFKKTNKFYAFFALVLLLAVFMAKGTNPPFGEINLWVFSHIPGMNIFRDPTKFYFFISLPFSIMIPLSFSEISGHINQRLFLKLLVVILFLFVLVFPIRDAIVGNIGGTFSRRPVPSEYIRLESFLSSQKDFFRTLWVSDQSQFRFISENHPMLIADSTLHTTSLQKIPEDIKKLLSNQELDRLSVKYIVVPDDTLGVIFLTDRKYDNSKRISLIKKLDTIPGLTKQTIGSIVLYENPHYHEHFFTEKGQEVRVNRISSQKYTLMVNPSSASGKILFSEAYNPGWEAKVGNLFIKSEQTVDGLNSFALPKNGTTVSIVFVPGEYQGIYYAISLVSAMVFLVYIVATRKKFTKSS